eukprot:TRINITY_DN7598_c0_g1_i1.p1 TRINITY_DN7598_c0_g1~~TRINITY_DN7598_c0_g1_i1.p1  ORF type:complete len:522 (+),score=49.47 TRINITY_DN7598_c0_g1_i1:112-1677(+)
MRTRPSPPLLQHRAIDRTPRVSLGTILFHTVSFGLYVCVLLFLLLIADVDGDPNTLDTLDLLVPEWGPQTEMVYFALVQILLFGWLYAFVLGIWERSGVDHIDALAVVPSDEDDIALDPDSLRYHKSAVMGRFPFLTFGRSVGSHSSKVVFDISSVLTHFIFWSIVGYVSFQRLTDLQTPGNYPMMIFPLAPFAVFFLFPLLPFAPPHWTTRLSLGSVLGQVLSAVLFPVWGVKFVHVVVADALTSASLTLWYFEYSVCYYITGTFLNSAALHSFSEVDVCGHNSMHMQIMQPIMVGLPFWIRFIQCLYRVFETRDKGWVWAHTQHIVNSGKYFSALMVVLTSTANHVAMGSKDGRWTAYRFAWLAAVVVKTTYCYVWDLTMDWDLLSKSSTQTDEKTLLLQGARVNSSEPVETFPPLLRHQRMYKYTFFYYFAMVTNFFMRISWTVAISNHLDLPKFWKLLMALVEIMRRAQWLTFRFENEHLQNLSSRRRRTQLRGSASSLSLSSRPGSDREKSGILFK